MTLSFFKMQAQGNDYLYFDFLQNPVPDVDFSALSRTLSRRSFSVGGDGIVLIEPHKRYDARMRIFNADGSEGRMCGSALRCVSVYLAGKLGKDVLEVDTLSGLKIGRITAPNCAEVDMGRVVMTHDKPVELNNMVGHTVNVGNPHFVHFVEILTSGMAPLYGPGLEKNMLFPDGVNIEFVEVVSPSVIRISIWERGSGATLACGTGACAAAFAAMQKKGTHAQITVRMPGGVVQVRLENKHAFLAGEVHFVYRGELEL
jgi:diaminopimelate epimerase